MTPPCPHCRMPTVVKPMEKRTAEAQRQPDVAGRDVEMCPECGWWCCPPRDAFDPHLLARSADGRGTSWVP